MWASLAVYLYCIVVLNIANRGVKAEYDFRGFFYPLPRNIVNWRRAGDSYASRIYMGSQPAAAVHFSYSGDYKSIGDHCYTNSFIGICTLTSKCPDVVKDIRNGKSPVVCSYQTSEAVVCCPKPNNNSPYYQQGVTTSQHNQNYQLYRVPQNNQNHRTHRDSEHRRSEQKCEEYSRLAARSGLFTSLSILASTQIVNIPTCSYSTGLIIGGDVTKPGEFPHMAAIGWTKNGKKDWKCGGSLISEQFVLTAGHCSSAYGILPDSIRLGEQNLVRQDDGADPQEYQITSVIVHPKYKHSSNYHDIALIRLNRQVTFTQFVRPACLWENKSINSTKAIATGWGQIEFAGDRSDELRKVSLNIIDNSKCQQLYESSKKLRRGIVNSQLCAGFLQGGKDTCLGDSGGPIQVITPRNQCVFHIIGITSFGKTCAAVNAAAVYTRVSSYVDWIESIAWPQ